MLRSPRRWKPFKGRARHFRNRSLASLRYTGRVAEASYKDLDVYKRKAKIVFDRNESYLLGAKRGCHTSQGKRQGLRENRPRTQMLPLWTVVGRRRLASMGISDQVL